MMFENFFSSDTIQEVPKDTNQEKYVADNAVKAIKHLISDRADLLFMVMHMKYQKCPTFQQKIYVCSLRLLCPHVSMEAQFPRFYHWKKIEKQSNITHKSPVKNALCKTRRSRCDANRWSIFNKLVNREIAPNKANILFCLHRTPLLWFIWRPTTTQKNCFQNMAKWLAFVIRIPTSGSKSSDLPECLQKRKELQNLLLCSISFFTKLTF